MTRDDDLRPRLWSVGLSGLSGMHYKVIAKSFEDALDKAGKLAEKVCKEQGEKDK